MKTEKSDSSMIYSIRMLTQNSPMAAAVVDRTGSLIYKNEAYDKLTAKSNADISQAHTGNAYEGYISSENGVMMMYVSPIGEDKSIVNLVAVKSVYDDYFTVLSAAVRHAAGNVAAAADNLSDICRDKKTAELLNSIDGSMLTLVSEFLIPEQLMQLRLMSKNDFPIVSISEEMNKYTAELGCILVKQPLEIRADIEAGLCARIDTKALRLILTDFAVKSMQSEYYIQNAAVKLHRNSLDMMTLSLTCGFLMHLPQKYESKEVLKPDDFAPSDELRRIICEKFSCEIHENTKTNYFGISIDIPIEKSPDSKIIRSSVKYFASPSRFCDENAYFARLGLNETYLTDDCNDIDSND